MPTTLSIPLRAKLLKTKAWKTLFFFPALHPFTPFLEGRANSPSDWKGKGKEEKIVHASTIMSCTMMASDDFFPVAEPMCARATLWGWKSATLLAQETPPPPEPSHPAIRLGILSLMM